MKKTIYVMIFSLVISLLMTSLVTRTVEAQKSQDEKIVVKGDLEGPDYLQPPKHYRTLKMILAEAGIIPKLKGPPPLPVSGTREILVILAELSDATPDAAHTVAYFNDRFFDTAPPSVRDYYNEVSYNNFTYVPGTVLGWYTSTHSTANWNNWSNAAIADCRDVVFEAIQNADPFFNFAAYDTDGDGIVTNEELTIFIIVSGNIGGAYHWYTNSTHPDLGAGPGSPTCDGVIIEGEFSITHEDRHIGSYCHELGHDLGLPDLYDTSDLITGGSEGIGNYGLMGGGSWTFSHITAWSKIQLGWITPTVVTTNGYYDVDDVETNAEAFILINPSYSSDEYFLIENRHSANSYYETVGWPVAPSGTLPDDGIVIYHIDEQKIEDWISFGWNNVNVDETHKGVDVETAEHPSSHFLNADDMDAEVNRGDADDLWDANEYDFYDLSTSCDAEWYGGTTSGVGALEFPTISPTMRVYLFISPIADFVANVTSGPAPLIVNFSDLSKGNITSWSWVFDNGNIDGTPTPPPQQYNTPGDYTVSLTVTGPRGSDTETKTSYIHVNFPPVVTNLAISPANPKTTDNLVGSYIYTDVEGDPQGPSEIRWYKDGVHQTDYDDVLIVPDTATAKCQDWYFTVKPHDGIEFGDLAYSDTVHISNTPPTASDLAISPSKPLDTDTLRAIYTYSDIDGDPENGSEIRWYKNGVHQPAFDDSLTVPDSATTATEYWHFTVKPCDGEDFGDLQTLSPAVPIDMRVVIEAEAMQDLRDWCGSSCTNGWRLCTQDQPIYEDVDFPADFLYHFTVTAKGEMAGDAAPWLKVQLGSAFEGTCEITSTVWDNYCFIASLTAGIHQLSLTFLNDWCDPYVGDRNLLLDKVVVRCQFGPLPTTCFTFEAEEMSQQNYTNLPGNYAVLYQYYSYVAHSMFFEQPDLNFEIIAKADFGSGGWPEMELCIDSDVRSVTVDNASDASYLFHVTGITAGEHLVKIDFKNDSYASGRKLYVDKLIIHTVDGELLKPETNEPISNEENAVAVPEKFALSQNFPNPFNPETSISFQIPEESYVVLKVFNLLGKEIKTLVNETKQAGNHTVQWDGRDNNGNKVVSGLYLYQIKAGNFSCIKKMALMK